MLVVSRTKGSKTKQSNKLVNMFMEYKLVMPSVSGYSQQKCELTPSSLRYNYYVISFKKSNYDASNTQN